MNSAQSQFDVLLSYAAPAGGRLTDEMLDIYDKAGVILLRDFVSAKACKAPRERALELVEQFDPAEVQSVFSTTKQTRPTNARMRLISNQNRLRREARPKPRRDPYNAIFTGSMT